VALFGETGGRVVLACDPNEVEALERLADELEVPLRRVGSAGGSTLLGVELAELRSSWSSEESGAAGPTVTRDD
jgi:hypothetical protein